MTLTKEKVFGRFSALKKSTRKGEPLVDRLTLREKVIQAEVVPLLCRNTGTVLGLENYAGGWTNSWAAENNK